MNYMFSRCFALTTIYVSPFDASTEMGWSTAEVTTALNMFGSCSNLVGGNGTEYSATYKDATYARIDTEETPGYFTDIADKI